MNLGGRKIINMKRYAEVWHRKEKKEKRSDILGNG